ncbi:short chain dehydrogenase reductase [Podospora aff. communis PSN243]|uniref:Short chain dehydrogenase reductase n=1 Tax=Podospora aff. communis PSN243 TaxID=3040156 RepID=A0AAV9GFG6_9PEZI|nr:short chain dehydrogenase reductase [Podospora aff. communis PSN243]
MAMPSPITPYHQKLYPAIDPTRPELSTAGKSILITGAGSGIGAETALAFAKSGASHIGLVGRRASALESTKSNITSSHPNVTVHILPADITSLPSITSALQTFASSLPSGNQKIDVLVACAGYINAIAPLSQTDPVDFWKVFEVNVQGNYNLLRAFRDVRAAEAVVLHVDTAMAHMAYIPGYAAYQASKLAATKVFEHFGAEEEGVRVVQYHPGLYKTEIGGTTEHLGLPWDEIDLAGGFAVWAASEEAGFLDGRFVWAAWDVDGLKELRGRLEGDRGLFTVGLEGFPVVK